jgi:RNA polymerase sigma-70 factor (ECF subfamily)
LKGAFLARNQQQDDKWFRLLRSGDHRAFADFVEKYKEQVFLCCRTLGLREDEAEDVASETFMAAYKAISRYRGQAELGTWLWSIAYRQGVNYLRKNRRRAHLLSELNTKLAAGKAGRPEEAAQYKEKEDIVWEAVRQLPRLWALAVILHYREQKTIKDIAMIMRTKQNTIKTYLLRARKRLRELLADILGEDIDVSR